MPVDVETMKAALIGYSAERQRIQEAIAAIHKQLRGHAVVVSDGTAPKAKPHLSAAARKRIAAAQKARWREFHQQKAAAAK